MVVQKQKRNTKTKEKEAMVNTVAEGGGRKIPVKVNANGNINGSRFGALLEVNEENNLGVNIHEENATESITGRQVAGEIENKKRKKSQNEVIIPNQQQGGVEKGVINAAIIGVNDGGVDCVVLTELDKDGDEVASRILQTVNHEKIFKGTKLGARNKGSFKGRSASKNNSRATMENMVDNLEKNKLPNIFTEQFQPVRESGNISGIPNEKGGLSHKEVGLPLGLTLNGGPYAPRPPDLLNTPPYFNNQLSI
jgi:hypothetical protein